MIIFGRPVSPGELWMGLLSMVSFALGVIGNVTGTARQPTLIALSMIAVALLLALLVALARQTYVIVGYKNTMTLLERLARSARCSLWTVRTHQGAADPEQKYFEIIHERLVATDKPLEDFRRIVRIGIQSATEEHLEWLVQHLSNQPAAHIRTYQGSGPSFDFMVVDRRIAVIGLPQSGGLDNSAALVVRGRAAVAGVEAIFDALFSESRVFFDGKRQLTSKERSELLSKAAVVVNSLPGTV
jgi:hypothetical protein